MGHRLPEVPDLDHSVTGEPDVACFQVPVHYPPAIGEEVGWSLTNVGGKARGAGTCDVKGAATAFESLSAAAR